MIIRGAECDKWLLVPCVRREPTDTYDTVGFHERRHALSSLCDVVMRRAPIQPTPLAAAGNSSLQVVFIFRDCS